MKLIFGIRVGGPRTVFAKTYFFKIESTYKPKLIYRYKRYVRFGIGFLAFEKAKHDASNQDLIGLDAAV